MDLVTRIAKQAHEVNRAYCASLGDYSQPSWEDAPDWQKDSAINGVRAHLADPLMTPDQSHKSWMAQKEAEGWKYGPVKDPEKKEHPCMVEYIDLPVEQRTKDYLFKGVVESFRQDWIEWNSKPSLSDNQRAAIHRHFTYHPPKPDQLPRFERIRQCAGELAAAIYECTPECADQTAAIRKVREAVMTANAAIACHE